MFTGNIIYKINPFGYSLNHLEKCAKCGECYAEINMEESEDGRFCDHCMEYFNECGSCGRTFLIANMYEVIGMPDICGDCKREEDHMERENEEMY